jgi:hypothetical protein
LGFTGRLGIGLLDFAVAEKIYPGEVASALQVQALAEEYCKASHVLLSMIRRGEPLTRAPFRLTAIHAIELYLNALLLHYGYKAAHIRGFQHDVWSRTELAIAGGLKLRQRTIDHLRVLSASREYLVTRYGPELASTTSQLNRLTATLNEVAEKVTATVATS